MDAILAAIETRLLKNPRLLIAIDGQSASGKTTLAQAIYARFGGNVFHMDDFFLPPEKRCAARFEEPGGNVDYERFKLEVLDRIDGNAPFSYRPFSCRTGALGAPVRVFPEQLSIVEGAYSLHPYFLSPYDLKIFMGIDPNLQRARIQARNGARAELFFTRWIPMENRYLAAFGIQNQCQITRIAQ